MPEYQFKGVDKAGKTTFGKIEAQSEGELRMILRSRGVRPTQVTKVGIINQDLGSLIKKSGKSIPTEALIGMTRQLHVLISSGVPLIQALEVLSEQSASPALTNIINVIRDKVSQGSYLWEALSIYPRVFPKLYIALVRAGESSGSLDQMLKRLGRYLEDADRVRKLVKSAMIYPIITVAIGLVVMAAMLVFVIPKFEELLKGSGQELPAPTQFVIDMSHFVIHNALYVFGGIGGSIYLTLRYVKSEEGKAVVDRLRYKLPIFGPLTQKAGMARLSRTMQTLLAAGINLIDAIDICRATVGNAVIEDAVGKIRTNAEAGKTLGAVVNGLKVFPKMAVQMITVGESTGNLDKMLEKIADFYEEEVETFVAGITKLIEPFILVFLGGAVGGLLIAMYLPIFKMAGGASE